MADEEGKTQAGDDRKKQLLPSVLRSSFSSASPPRKCLGEPQAPPRLNDGLSLRRIQHVPTLRRA